MRVAEVFWILYIAASLRLTETHADGVRLFTNGEDDSLELWDDLVTEDAKVIMADTFAGDTRALEALAGNPAVGIWNRGAVIHALAILRRRGVVSLETLTEIYARQRDLLLSEARVAKGRGESCENVAILATALLMVAGLDLREPSLRALLWPLVEADLWDETILNWT